MLTALLLFSLFQPAPAPATSCPRVEYPSLPVPRVEGMPEPLPMRTCEPSRNVAALMYAVGIDPAVPVEVVEVEADIYQDETP